MLVTKIKERILLCNLRFILKKKLISIDELEKIICALSSEQLIARDAIEKTEKINEFLASNDRIIKIKKKLLNIQ